VSRRRLWQALAASAALHLALLAGLLAFARPGASTAPRLRVSLLGASSAGSDKAGSTPREPGRLRSAESGAAAVASGANVRQLDRDGAGAARPVPPVSEPLAPRHAARRKDAVNAPEPGGDGNGSARVAALVTPVQSDLWVLPRSGSGATATASHPAGSGPVGNGEGPPAGIHGPQGGSPGQGGGASAEAAGQGSSLLTALSERLAWSARRCAPPSLAPLTRRAVPVPLRFCLDGAGRPSEVGLLGTTGSEQLDQVARDCVVPEAAPLPPAPGCYTVEVRFPRG